MARIWLAALAAVRLAAGMNLQLTLEAPPGRCQAGGECWLVYRITNKGAAAARVHDPDPGRDHAPTLYLSRAGNEQRSFTPRREIEAPILTLEPGQKVEYAVRLEGQWQLAEGEYRVWAVLDPLGINLRAPAIRLKVGKGRK